MIFLLQKDTQDFIYEVKNACEFKNWMAMKKEALWIDVEMINAPSVFRKYIGADYTLIPVGSIEFVHLFYKIVHDIDIQCGVNIPEELFEMKYLDRSFYSPLRIDGRWHLKPLLTKTDADEDPTLENKKIFCKSKHVKEYVDVAPTSLIFRGLESKHIKPDECIFSEAVEFETEYRCFVCEGELLDCRCYAGDFRMQPDYTIIEEMIEKYKNNSYTLDVGINERGNTVVIEVHDFYSCGLYGFADYPKLIKMILLTHFKILKNK